MEDEMEMTGTAKQIEWAAKIKADMLNQLALTINTMAIRRRSANGDAILAILTPALEAQIDAAWWIDHRDTPAAKLAASLITPDQQAAIKALN